MSNNKPVIRMNVKFDGRRAKFETIQSSLKQTAESLDDYEYFEETGWDGESKIYRIGLLAPDLDGGGLVVVPRYGYDEPWFYESAAYGPHEVVTIISLRKFADLDSSMPDYYDNNALIDAALRCKQALIDDVCKKIRVT